jgi:hypothetical protein
MVNRPVLGPDLNGEGSHSIQCDTVFRSLPDGQHGALVIAAKPNADDERRTNRLLSERVDRIFR